MVKKNFPSPVGEYVPDSFPRTAPFGSWLRRSQAITASASAENGTSSCTGSDAGIRFDDQLVDCGKPPT
jgi:hypothetical protein